MLYPNLKVETTSAALEEIERAVPNSQHVYHHNAERKPTANLKIEQNSRGFNWSITIENVSTPEEAKELLEKMRLTIGEFLSKEEGLV